MSAPAEMFAGMERVAILHDARAAAGDAASRDVFDQIEAAERVFHQARVASRRIPVDLDLHSFRNALEAFHPDIALNLVESLDGHDRLQSIVPLTLESWRIPFTGCGSAAMMLSNDKIASKRILHRHGIPVPECAFIGPDGGLEFFPPGGPGVRGDWICKPLDSHASLFMDDGALVAVESAASLEAHIGRRTARHHAPFFAERFIQGREFNLGILEEKGGPRVLPPGEIIFDLPPGKPHIVGYAAKWDEASPEYRGTRRVFPDPAVEGGLLSRLGEIALAAWQAMGLSGYARIDFRVGREGGPAVLEANSNPCLSPDAGFAAAAERDGMEYGGMLAAILAAAHGTGR